MLYKLSAENTEERERLYLTFFRGPGRALCKGGIWGACGRVLGDWLEDWVKFVIS